MVNSGWEWVDIPLANQGGIWRQVRPKKIQLSFHPPDRIIQLTPDQQLFLERSREKWRSYTLSNKPIDRPFVSQIIHAAYRGLTHTQAIHDQSSKPTILFFDTPELACPELLRQWITQKQIEERKRERRHIVQRKLWDDILMHRGIPEELDPFLKQQHYQEPPSFTWKEVWEGVEERLYQEYMKNYWGRSSNTLPYFGEDKVRAGMRADLLLPDAWANHCSWLEFCIHRLNYYCNPDAWQALQDVMRHSGWFFPFDEVCIVCDRAWL